MVATKRGRKRSVLIARRDEWLYRQWLSSGSKLFKIWSDLNKTITEMEEDGQEPWPRLKDYKCVHMAIRRYMNRHV